MNADLAGSQAHINGDIQHRELSSEYKEKKKLAKRIVKAVQPSLEDATRKESELLRKSSERELERLDRLLELCLLSQRDSQSQSFLEDATHLGGHEAHFVSGSSAEESLHNAAPQANDKIAASVNGLGIYHDNDLNADDLNAVSSRSEATNTNGIVHERNTFQESKHTPPMQGFDLNGGAPKMNPNIQILEPPTPPLSTGGDPQPLSNGGIPWYMETFDPDGTTVYEERWTGRDLVRGMSEELSDMGDEELSGLVDVGTSNVIRGGSQDGIEDPDAAAEAARAAEAEKRRKINAKRRRARNGYR